MGKDLTKGAKVKYHTAVGDFDGEITTCEYPQHAGKDGKGKPIPHPAAGKPMTAPSGSRMAILTYRDGSGTPIEVQCEEGSFHGMFSLVG